MKILLIGDKCLDVFVEGHCDRLSPEAPVPVFTPLSSGSNAGMAGNVEANLRSLCPMAEIVTIYPKQESVKTRYVDKRSNQHLLRIDSDEIVQPLSQEKPIDLTGVDAVVLSDYNKGFLTKQNMEWVTAWANSKHIPVFVDTKKILGTWSRDIDFVKINQKEFEEQHKWVRPDKECRQLIVTKGAEGMELWTNHGFDGVIHKVGGVSVDVADQVGCGDSVLAALVVRYLSNGNNILTAMQYANKVGAIAASHRGVVAVKWEDVE